MPPFTVIFAGTPEFACPSLKALNADADFEVTHVITQPDKPVGRKREITPPPVKVLAEELGIEVLQPGDVNELCHGSTPLIMAQESPDFLVVVAYGQKLGQEMLEMPKIAPVNLHPSLLPHLRGPSPIQNSLLAGDEETGVTIQKMVEEIDAGPLLSEEKVKIEPRETKNSLTEKLAEVGAGLLLKTLKSPLKETAQDESKVTHCKKLTRTVGHVDPEKMTAQEIDRHVRALVPWPGVRVTKNDVKLIETSLAPHPDAFELQCADGTMLYVLKMQTSGKNVVSGVEWGRGNLQQPA